MYESLSQQYFDKGLAVLPVTGKRPFVKDWVNHDFESDDNEYIGKNLGLKTGKPSGVICVDIDTSDNELKQKIYELLPPLYSGKIGNQDKGINYFFAYNGEINRKIGGVVEILSTGNQTVLPPSIHPGTSKSYEWRGKSLLEIDIDNLPPLPADFIENIEKLLDVKTGETKIIPSDGSRCNHNSHNKLSQVMVSMIHEGKTPQDIALELLNYDKKINQEISYFLCPSRKWKSGSTAELNAYDFVLEGMRRHLRTGEIKKVPLEEFKVTIGDIKTTEKVRLKYPKFRGIAQEMFQYIYQNSPVPRSRLACSSVISLMSVVLANKIEFEGVRPNLYSLMVSPSGFGKDFPLKFVKRALIESGHSELIGQSMPASDSGVIKTLPNQRERIDVIDEASVLFGAISNGGNQYSTNMRDIYASLYTSTGDYFEGKILSTKEKVIGACHSPYISILGAMTPNAAMETITTDTITTGLGARFLFFIDDERKRARRVGKRPDIPRNIKNFIKKWRNQHESEKISIKTGFNAPALLQAKCSCPKSLDEVHEMIEDLKERADEKIQPIINRAMTTILKLAMIDACATQYSSNDITIKEDNLAWAVKFFEVNFKETKEFITDSISNSQNEKQSNKVLEIIKNSGAKGVTMSILTSRTRWLTASQRKSILSDLIESDLILAMQRETKGRKKTVFILQRRVNL